MNTFLEAAKLRGTVHGSGCVTYWNRNIGKWDSNIIRKLLSQKDSNVVVVVIIIIIIVVITMQWRCVLERKEVRNVTAVLYRYSFLLLDGHKDTPTCVCTVHVCMYMCSVHYNIATDSICIFLLHCFYNKNKMLSRNSHLWLHPLHKCVKLSPLYPTTIQSSPPSCYNKSNIWFYNSLHVST
jgi:hypothetical protein